MRRVSVYKLGAVGFGHWFDRLYKGISNQEQIKISKIAGTRDWDSKHWKLSALGYEEKDYYIVRNNDPIPKEFFDDIDIVHISDPNQFHAAQTVQSLENGKMTITEKTFGVNKKEFTYVTNYIRDNGLENKAYLHLHYLHKLLTLELESRLKKYTRRHGKIVRATATFFEPQNDEDMRRRTWLFSLQNGGIFMDWIHPFEVFYYGAKADGISLNDVDLYATNLNYSMSDPTGVAANVSFHGRYFADDATGKIKIAKGLQTERKHARFVFESGAYLDLNFMSSEKEIANKEHGTFAFYEKGKLAELYAPKGKNTSELLVNDILALCKGDNQGLKMDMWDKIFEPQWKYQEMCASKQLIFNKKEVAAFIREGLNISGMKGFSNLKISQPIQ